MNDPLTLLLLVLAFILAAVLLFLLYKPRSTAGEKDLLTLFSQWSGELRSSMERQSELIARQMAIANDNLNQRLESTTQLLRLLNKDLGEVHEIGRQMQDFQRFFRAPQLRGRIGERLMSEILLQIIPASHVKLQHRFSNGVMVDALILLQQGSLPIDCKFPLENLQRALGTEDAEAASSFQKEFYRDVRRHIEAVRAKYIRPSEGTLDFAVMYVPSETIYYEILQQEELVRTAEEQNVLMVSPHSFYYLLKLILYGLYSSRWEKTAAALMQRLSALQVSARETQREMATLSAHLNNAKNAGDRLQQRLAELAHTINEIAYHQQEGE